MSWEFKSPHPHSNPPRKRGFFIAEFFVADRFATVRALGRVGEALSLCSPMLVLKITNASEVVAAKVGKLIEALTPDLLDQSQVEDVLIKELIKNLSAEGLKGEVAAVRGLDLKESSLVINDGMHVRRHQSF